MKHLLGYWCKTDSVEVGEAETPIHCLDSVGRLSLEPAAVVAGSGCADYWTAGSVGTDSAVAAVVGDGGVCCYWAAGDEYGAPAMPPATRGWRRTPRVCVAYCERDAWSLGCQYFQP